MLWVYVWLIFQSLTSSRRIPYKHAIFCWNADRRASKRVFRFLCVLAGSLVNTSPVACHCAGWRVYTQSFLGVRGFTVRWQRTSSFFCGFLPNPFIQDLFLLMYQSRICKDGFISIVFDLSHVCRLFDRVLSILGRYVGACERSNCAEERWL